VSETDWLIDTLPTANNNGATLAGDRAEEIVSEAEKQQWEAEFRARLNDLLAQRLGPLASEIGSLQATFNDVCARLVEQANPSVGSEKSGVEETIHNWLADEEHHHQEQLAEVRSAAAASLERARARRMDERASFNAATAEIDRQRTQSGVLTALLDAAALFIPRVALFVVRGDRAVGWKARGVMDDSIGTLSLPLDKTSIVGESIANEQSIIADPDAPAEYRAVLGDLNHNPMARSLAVPLVIRDKAAAALYADADNEDEFDVQPLEALVRVAGLAIELLPLRRGIESTPAEVMPPRVFTSRPRVTVEIGKAAPPIPFALAQTTPEVAPEMAAEPGPADEAVAEEALEAAPVELAPIEAPSVEAASIETSPVEASADEEVAVAETSLTEDEVDEVIEGELAEESPSTADLPPASDLPSEWRNEPTSAPTRELNAAPTANLAESDFAREAINQFEVPETARLGIPEAEEIPPPPPAPRIRSKFEPHFLSGDGEADAAQSGKEYATALTDEDMIEVDGEEVPGETTEEATEEAPAEVVEEALETIAEETLEETSEEVIEESIEEEEPISLHPPASRSDHNDARRYARFLVAEIKLYNSAKVAEGLRRGDLFDRLREEIERNRQLYDRHVSTQVTSEFDYFYDELVQTLAEGEADKLGRNCPRPAEIVG
jgi:hypothetical protein